MEIDVEIIMKYPHAALGVALFILITCCPAFAEQVCTMQIHFENQTSGSQGGHYKLGVLLDKSMSRTAKGQLSPLKSKKAVWTQSLGVGEQTKRTVNVRFTEPCTMSRNFSLYVCWKKMGRSGTPACLKHHRAEHFIGGSWRWRVALIPSQDIGRSPTVVVTKATQIEPRRYH